MTVIIRKLQNTEKTLLMQNLSAVRLLIWCTLKIRYGGQLHFITLLKCYEHTSNKTKLM